MHIAGEMPEYEEMYAQFDRYLPEALGGGKVLYIGNIIKNQFGAIRNWPLGAAMSVLLLAITALMIFLYSRFAKVEDMEVV